MSELLERKIAEAAEWFCDNPNCGDIKDAMRELVAEAVSMENEACAKVCEVAGVARIATLHDWTRIIGDELAAAIRERSNKY